MSTLKIEINSESDGVVLPAGNIIISIAATSSAVSHSRSIAYCLRERGEVLGALMSLVAASRTDATSCGEARVLSGENVRTDGVFA